MSTAKTPATKTATTTKATSAAKAPAAKAPVAKPAAAKAKKAAPATAAVQESVADACELPTPAAKDAPRKRFRMLTGVDDSAFCQKVSDALDDGYELYGSPTMTFNGTNVIVGQAVILKKRSKKRK
jgi:hypothetical protein